MRNFIMDLFCCCFTPEENDNDGARRVAQLVSRFEKVVCEVRWEDK